METLSEATRTRLRELIAWSPLPTIVADVQGQVLLCDPRVAGVLNAAALPATTLDAMMTLSDALPWSVALQSLEPNPQQTTTVRCHTRNGHAPVLAHLRALDVTGADLVALSVEQDPTRTLHKHVTEHARRAEHLQQLGQLSGRVAHDFNNQLAIILGLATICQRAPGLSPPTLEALQRIERSARRSADLCNQLLIFEGRGGDEQNTTNVAQAARDITALLQMTLPRGGKLVDELDPGNAPTSVEAAQVRQTIMTLLLNAAEALGEQGTITLRTSMVALTEDQLRGMIIGDAARPGLHIALECTDDGPGMDAATLQRIFTPFFSTRGPGRGLGLGAVATAVRSWRGALHCESAPGAGARFVLYFPRAVEAAPTPLPNNTPDTLTDALDALNVLVVDDEENIRWFLRRALARLGATVSLTRSGEEGLALVRGGERFELAILDLAMPGMNGEQTARALRQLQPELPVLISTGRDPQEITQRLSDLKRVAVLQKPYGIRALRETLRSLLGLSL